MFAYSSPTYPSPRPAQNHATEGPAFLPFGIKATESCVATPAEDRDGGRPAGGPETRKAADLVRVGLDSMMIPSPTRDY